MCREGLILKFLWCKRLTLKRYWLHFLSRFEFGLCFVKNHRQGLWRYHFISEQTLKRLSWWKFKLHSLKTRISQFKSFSELLSAKYFPSIRCLSLGIIAINFFHAEIVFTLPFRTMTVKLRSAAGNKFSGCFLNEKIWNYIHVNVF